MVRFLLYKLYEDQELLKVIKADKRLTKFVQICGGRYSGVGLLFHQEGI